MSGPSNHPSGSGMAGPSGGGPPQVSVQEFSIRVPKNLKKKHHVMRFNATLNVDFTQWRSVKMERENNLKEFKGFDEDMPKFGAGSEFNRDLREEARRKRYGIIAKKYRPDAQPWILKAGGKKDGKKFRGIREGGVGENAAFYVFTHAPDGAIEAYPLNEWYNFQPIQRYKALSAEEAEHEFGRRKKVMNYFSLMLRKRMKGDEDNPEELEEVKGKKGGGGGKAKDLKISDMDEWIDSDEMSSSEGEDAEGKPKEKDSDDEDKKAKNKKKALADAKKKKRDVDEEAFEESDDGDEEGRELDYISDSSESESEPETKANKELKSVAEEDALRKLLTSDEDSEDEENSEKNKDKDGENAEDEKNGKSKEKEKESKEKDSKESKKKKKNKKKKKTDTEKKETSSGSSSDSSDSDNGDNSNSKQPPKKKHKKEKEGGQGSNLSSANNSRSASPSLSQLESNKRKHAGSNMPTTDLTGSDNSNSPMSTPAKKHKHDSAMALPPTFTGLVSSNSKDDYGITEEAVRRYLMRKPMTTTELLTKFKNKKTGVSSEKLVETMTAILKKINPVKQTIQGKMYLSIKLNK